MIDAHTVWIAYALPGVSPASLSGAVYFIGLPADVAQGLTEWDLKRLNVRAEDVGKPVFAVPEGLKKLGKGLQGAPSGASTPVDE